MAHSQLTRANQAGIHYTRVLASAYRRFSRLWDPDYAHVSDVEAWNKIRRDAVIFHAIQKRSKAVAGVEWRMSPASDSPADKRAAEIMTYLIGKIRRFSESRVNLAEDSIFRGSGYAFIEGEREDLKVSGDSKSRRWWAPTFLRHVDRWRFQIRRDYDIPDPTQIKTFWEFFSIEKQDWERLENPQWFVQSFTAQKEETLGYGRGLLQSIFFYWRAKTIALQHGLAGLERWAMGFATIAVDDVRVGSDDRDNDALVDAYIEEFTTHRTEHVFVHGKNDEVKFHEGGGGGYQIVRQTLDYLDRALNQVILTSVLPTGGGGEVGSMARAEVEADQAEATYQSDRAAISEDITDSLVALVWQRNRALFMRVMMDEGLDLAEMPSFEIVQQVKQDLIANTQSAIQILQAGVPLVKTEFYERTGWTEPGEDDDIIEIQQAGAGGGMDLPFTDSDSVPSYDVAALRSEVRDAVRDEVRKAVAEEFADRHRRNGDEVSYEQGRNGFAA